MKLLKYLALSLFLLIFALPANSQSGIELISGRKAKINFTTANNLIFIPVELNGVQLTFLLDTGINKTILFNPQSLDIPLKNVKKIKLVGLGEDLHLEGLQSQGNSIKIGEKLALNNKDIYAIISDRYDLSSHLGFPVHGIIGYDFFENYPVKISYTQKTIIVYRKTKKFKRQVRKLQPLPIVLKENKPYLQTALTINENRLEGEILLDSGNSDAFMLFQDDKEITASENGIETYLGQGLLGDIFGIRKRVKKIEFTNHHFKAPIVSIPYRRYYEKTELNPKRTGSIGGEIFKRFTWFIDYKHRSVYLKANRNFSNPFYINMSGMEIVYQGEKWQVKNSSMVSVSTTLTDLTKEKPPSGVKFSRTPVFSVSQINKNSPAEKAGVRVGDVITHINGQSASTYTLEKIYELFKSEDNKMIRLQVNRGEKEYKFQFRLTDPIPVNSRK